MSLLILALPPTDAAETDVYLYASSNDGRRVRKRGQATISLLPPAGRGVEVVAVAPVSRLAWQRVELPRGVGPRSPQLQNILINLLEDQLLQDPSELHFALEPQADNRGGTCHVAICERVWLQSHLQALATGGRPVSRIVPEMSPNAQTTTIWFTGTLDRPALLANGPGVPGDVASWPFSAKTGENPLALIQQENTDTDATPTWQTWAEPAVESLAASILGRHATIRGHTSRLMDAQRSSWNLAQFQLANSARARTLQRAGAANRDFWYSSRWRPARWGLLALILTQLVGLNVWAWQTRHELTARKNDVRQTLIETFPHVKLVVDAPLQMEREVTALRQRTGSASPGDLAALLGAWARLNKSQPPRSIEYTLGKLQLKGAALQDEALENAQTELRSAGYQIHAEDGGLLLRELGPSTAP